MTADTIQLDPLLLTAQGRELLADAACKSRAGTVQQITAAAINQFAELDARTQAQLVLANEVNALELLLHRRRAMDVRSLSPADRAVYRKQLATTEREYAEAVRLYASVTEKEPPNPPDYESIRA